MLKSLIQLFIIARKLAVSGAVKTVNEIYDIPFAIKIFLSYLQLVLRKNL